MGNHGFPLQVFPVNSSSDSAARLANGVDSIISLEGFVSGGRKKVRGKKDRKRRLADRQTDREGQRERERERGSPSTC